jgi:crossover junction endodeoxyribonuclease RuvC
MIVIAIDPGYDRLGVAIMSRDGQKETLIYSGCIETNKQDSLSDRLYTIGQAFDNLLIKYKPECLGIETLFFNKNIKTALGVAQARGVIMYLATNAQMKIIELGPQEIKIAVTGYGKSDKTAVIDMVKRLITTAPKKALDDEYDAIAIGIATLAHNR